MASVAAGLLAMAVLLVLLAPTSAPAQIDGGSSDVPQSILNRLTPNQAQQLLQGQMQQKGVPRVIPPVAVPERSVIIPLAPPPQVQTRSDLEKIMSDRAGGTLKQFGYDQLANGQIVTSAQIGAVQDNYILGVGDQLNVVLRGQENAEYTVTVDRDGRVTLPKLAPIAAAGRDFGDFREDLEAAIRSAYLSTKAFVTLTAVRQISVLVVGNVRNSGVQTLTGLSTILDALNLAGGIEKTGSLRDIVVVRGDRIIHIDLYDFLAAHKAVPDLTVAQGDRIIVPAIGPTVAIAGAVRRPGIYELPPGSESITQRGLINLGDGPQLPGAYRQMVLKIHHNGEQELVDETGKPGALVRDGEILFVEPAVNYSMGKVTLKGPVRLPGLYALNRTRTLHDLLPSADVFAPTPYMLLAVIMRTDPKTQQRLIIPFSPAEVIAGRENMDLVSDDVVQILTLPQMRALASPAPVRSGAGQNAPSEAGANPPPASGEGAAPSPVGTIGNGSVIQGSNGGGYGAGAQTEAGQERTQAALLARRAFGAAQSGGPTFAQGGMEGVAPSTGAEGAAATGRATEGAAGSGAASATEEHFGGPPPGASEAASALADIPESGYLARAISDYRVTLHGAVRRTGRYLIAPGTSLADLLAAAGGLDTDADTSGFEITSTEIENRMGRSVTHRQVLHTPPSDYGNVILHLLDNVTFHHVYTDRVAGAVVIRGQVRYPGTYSLLRGERLSELMVRAGGLTDVAYPYGTVFLRTSLAKQEQEAHERLARELERQLYREYAKGASSVSSNGGSNALGLQTFVDEIKNQKTLGRMTVIADPTVLAANPQKDPMLQPGDTVFIPQRPSTVMVIGAVMQAGNYEFTPDATVDDYIHQAGGYDDGAEEDMVFVVYPDGTARRVEQSWLRFNSAAIPPGSVIYVPRDMFPLDWRGLAQTMTTLFSNLAVSAASIAVISRNN